MWLLFAISFIHIPRSVDKNNSQLIKHLSNLFHKPPVTTQFVC